MNRIVLSILLVSLPVSSPWPANADAVSRSMATTFRITDGQTTGTGFFVRVDVDDSDATKLVFVTAGHALLQMKGETCQLIMRTRTDDGGYQRREVTVALRDAEGVRWKKHDNLDVGVLPVDIPDDIDMESISLDSIAGDEFVDRGDLRVGQSCRIPCFPAGLESNSAGWPVLRTGHIASFPLSPVTKHQSFIVDSIVYGGDSGAPVFVSPESTADPVVVGVVIGMHRQTTQVRTPYEEKTVHRPLGLAICVHGQYIRETISLIATER